jgi:uncharacterized protein with ATP-grasp and redox domains
MRMSAECVHCVLEQMDRYFMRFVGDEDERVPFLKKVCATIGAADEEMSSPPISAELMGIIAQKAGREDLFEEEKHLFNQVIMKMEDNIKTHIAKADDKLCRALQYAMTGNYIDFGLVNAVSTEKLDELIGAAPDMDLGPVLDQFRKDIEKARTMVYVLDNCGEVVFDKICIETIKSLYPSLHITALVRGMPTYNDVTPADAHEVGLDTVVPVLGNGDNIPGTLLSRISDEVRELLESADVVVSKGMGNYETLQGCGLNIYFMLLAKCDRFIREFQKPRFASIFRAEKAPL